jgi:hypothetical protein
MQQVDNLLHLFLRQRPVFGPLYAAFLSSTTIAELSSSSCQALRVTPLLSTINCDHG